MTKQKAKPAQAKAQYRVAVDRMPLDDGTVLLRGEPYQGDKAEIYLASEWIERV